MAGHTGRQGCWPLTGTGRVKPAISMVAAPIHVQDGPAHQSPRRPAEAAYRTSHNQSQHWGAGCGQRVAPEVTSRTPSEAVQGAHRSAHRAEAAWRTSCDQSWRRGAAPSFGSYGAGRGQRIAHRRPPEPHAKPCNGAHRPAARMQPARSARARVGARKRRRQRGRQPRREGGRSGERGTRSDQG